jgi:hypothetical protein
LGEQTLQEKEGYTVLALLMLLIHPSRAAFTCGFKRQFTGRSRDWSQREGCGGKEKITPFYYISGNSALYLASRNIIV